MKQSDALRRRIAAVSEHFDRANHLLWNHPSFSKLYPDLLILLHSVTRASVPLMQAAHTRLLDFADSAPTLRLRAYFESHIEEERGHDEWLLNDLHCLGVPRERPLQKIPSSAVAAAVGAQYYWIFHSHPIALLGYIAVLEGAPPNPEEVMRLATVHGLPPEAMSTIALHGALDPHHRSDFDAFIDTLTLDREEFGLVGLSAVHTVAWLTVAMEQLLASHPI